ncbi:MAG: ATPase, T2SS/T4P/T4SS family, partial [Candidatus Diapherotrites archaeon]|nr:ATPase, T2SS/T4P/T4SS family [Candidatus Diapherotrites archaeon]
MPDYLKDAIEKAKKAAKQQDETLPENVFSNQPSEQKMGQKIESVKFENTGGAPDKTSETTGPEKGFEDLDAEEEPEPNTQNRVPGKTLRKSGDVEIIQYPDRELLEYRVPVPKPTLGEKTVINIIKEAATQLISISPYRIRDPQQRRNVYYQRIMEILKNSPELKILPNRYQFYAESVVREMVGYGILDPLLSDDNIEEIMVIGPKKPVYIFHRQYDMMTTNIEFYSDKEIQNVVNKIARDVGRRVDFSAPLLDARLPDGSRVNATIPPASVDESTITIRKFRKDPYTIIDLIRLNTLDANTAAFLWLCVEGLNTKPANILISGGTGSGKTTLLNCLTSLVPERERIVTIEDTAELNLPLEHWIRLEARPPGIEGSGELALDILTKNSLRMRPDRIIVGEVRHAEAFTLFTAMNTGHDGCLTPDTKIALTSGITEIGTFVDCWLSRRTDRKENEWEIGDTENEFINSLDNQGKIHRSEIKQVRRRPYDGIVYHIKLASGNEITCTGDHPLYTFGQQMTQIRAQQLAEGQYLATPSRLLRDTT